MCCCYLLHCAAELIVYFPAYPAAVWTTVLCSCQVDVHGWEQHLWQERWVYCSSAGNNAAFCYLILIDFIHPFNINWLLSTLSLTIMPPPMTPPIYFTSSVIRPSLAYWLSPSGKNSPMFKAMDSMASGYRARAMKREHFPVHMVFLLRFQA